MPGTDGCGFRLTFCLDTECFLLHRIALGFCLGFLCLRLADFFELVCLCVFLTAVQICLCLLLFCVTLGLGFLLDFCLEGFLGYFYFSGTELNLALLTGDVRIRGSDFQLFSLLLFLNLVRCICLCLFDIGLFFQLCRLDCQIVVFLCDLSLGKNALIVRLFICTRLGNFDFFLGIGTGDRRGFLDFYDIVDTEVSMTDWNQRNSVR
mgnify:CR=1 FL=1